MNPDTSGKINHPKLSNKKEALLSVFGIEKHFPENIFEFSHVWLVKMFGKYLIKENKFLKNEKNDFPNGCRENKLHKWHSKLIVISPPPPQTPTTHTVPPSYLFARLISMLLT